LSEVEDYLIELQHGIPMLKLMKIANPPIVSSYEMVEGPEVGIDTSA
jgi:hypothetical protein